MTWYDTNKEFDAINSLRRKLIVAFSELLSETFQSDYLKPPFQTKHWVQNQGDLDNIKSS